MTGHPSVISRKGHVTIPAEIRHALRLKAGDIVVWQWDGDVLRLIPAQFTLESAFASVTPRSSPENFETLKKTAKGDKTTATMQKPR